MAEVISFQRFTKLPVPVTLFQGSTGTGSSFFLQSLLPEGALLLRCPPWSKAILGADPELQLLEAFVEGLENAVADAPEARSIWLELPEDSDGFLVSQGFHAQSPIPIEGARLHQVVTALDAPAFWQLFGQKNQLGEEDSETLEAEVARIEFCDLLLIRDLDRLLPAERARLLTVIRKLQVRAPVIEFDPGNRLLLEELPQWLDRRLYSPEETPKSAGWKALIEQSSPYVFRAKRPFHPQRLHQALGRWPVGILRACGQVWLASRNQTAISLSLSGPSVLHLAPEGPWIACLPKEDRQWALDEHPDLGKGWDPVFGDRSNEIAFIPEGNQDLRPFLRRLEKCLLTDLEMRIDWTAIPDPFPSGDREPDTDPATNTATQPPTPPSAPPRPVLRLVPPVESP